MHIYKKYSPSTASIDFFKFTYTTKMKTAKEAIKHFTPSWFSVTMGTGIVAILLYNFPYQFRGLYIIATVIYLLNILLFSTFTLISITRYVMFPEIMSLMLKHPGQSLFIGTIPMGLTTITNCTVLIAVPYFESWAITVAYALWWTEFALTLISSIAVPYYIIIYHNHKLETMNGTWLLPIVPAVVTAASGGLLAHVLDYERAFPIIIISYMLMGIGILLALSIIVIYFYRLTVHKLPPREVIISSFLPLGPLGQGAYGFIQLGSAAQKVMANDFGNTAYSFGILIALLLWGYGFWYLVVAIFSVIVTSSKKIPFNMGWWGLTFPLGVYTAATLALATAFDSEVLYVIASIFTILLVILWLVVAIRTIICTLTGEMFVAPCLTPVNLPSNYNDE